MGRLCRPVRLPPALIALAPLLWAGGVGAQEEAPPTTTHRIAIEVAGLQQALDDRMASPVRYSGTAPAVGLTYAGRAGPWRWGARGGFANPRLTSPVTTDESGFEDAAWGTASAELLRRLWRGARASVWAGPGVASELGVRRHVYAHETWLNFRNAFVALQAAIAGEVELGRGRLTETLALPVLGLSVRKEYAGVIRRDPRVEVAFPPFLALRHRLAYGRPLSPSLGVQVFHDLSLIRHDRAELAFLSHRLGVALEWRSAR